MNEVPKVEIKKDNKHDKNEEKLVENKNAGKKRNNSSEQNNSANKK